MKQYELTILVHPDFERDPEPVLIKIRQMISEVDGKIISEEKSDKKRLAYEINKQDSAIYIYIEADLPASSLSKLATAMNLSNEILRHLIVLKDDESSAAAIAKLAELEKEEKK